MIIPRYFDSRSEKVNIKKLLDEVEAHIQVPTQKIQTKNKHQRSKKEILIFLMFQDPMVKAFIKMELKFKYK